MVTEEQQQQQNGQPETTEGGRFAGRPAQVLAFSTAAAATAAVIGIATYMYLQRRAFQDPQEFLARCRQAIEQIERNLDS